MPNCTHPEGTPSTCRNRRINPNSNRLVQCQTCKDHNRGIQILKKRAATKRARHCRQAAHNLNKVINSDLITEDSALKQTLNDLEVEKATIEVMIESKLIEYETLARASQNIKQILPEVTTPPPDAPEVIPRGPHQEPHTQM